MCLENRLSGKEKEDAIAALPKTFSVWKFCPDGVPEFRNTKTLLAKNGYDGPEEPKLTAKRWHKAKVFPYRRSALFYSPGFHAFLYFRSALKYNPRSTLRKFEARRADVMEIGTFSKSYDNLKGVVLSHIKPV